MLSFLTGLVHEKAFNPNRCHLEVSGFGLLIHLSEKSFLNIKTEDKVKLHTSANFSLENTKIYGFLDLWEKELFELICSVKGIGGKSALTLIDTFSPRRIIQIISEEASEDLSKAPGIGKKNR